MPDTSIVNILTDAVYDRLVQVLITDVTDPETKAGLVKTGKLQDDPTVYMTNILIREEDDEPDTLFMDNDLAIRGFTHEVGGGMHWWRRLRVSFVLHFPPELDRDEARRRGFVIRSRAERAIETMTLPSDVDSFGERVYDVMVTKSYPLRDAGGDGNFIRKGELAVAFITERF